MTAERYPNLTDRSAYLSNFFIEFSDPQDRHEAALQLVHNKLEGEGDPPSVHIGRSLFVLAWNATNDELAMQYDKFLQTSMLLEAADAYDKVVKIYDSIDDYNLGIPPFHFVDSSDMVYADSFPKEIPGGYKYGARLLVEAESKYSPEPTDIPIVTITASVPLEYDDPDFNPGYCIEFSAFHFVCDTLQDSLHLQTVATKLRQGSIS